MEDVAVPRQRRRERLDRGIKIRTEGFYALLSWREITYLMLPRVVLVVVMFVVPIFLPQHWQKIICMAGVYALLALSFDILLSFVGLVTIGGALFMGAGGNNFTLIEHNDTISIFDSGKAVGNHKGCSVFAEIGKRLLDQFFILGIKRRGRFIKEQNGRIF